MFHTSYVLVKNIFLNNSLGQFLGLGHFLVGIICSWDVLMLGSFNSCDIWDVLYLGHFVFGTFCIWDIL